MFQKEPTTDRIEEKSTYQDKLLTSLQQLGGILRVAREP